MQADVLRLIGLAGSVFGIVCEDVALSTKEAEA